MGWNIFNRKRKEPEAAQPDAAEQGPDALLPALSEGQAREFTRLVYQTLAERGREGVVSDGALHFNDGSSHGLHNLSIAAAEADPRIWPTLVREHVQAMEQIDAETDDIPADDTVFLRLRMREDLGDEEPAYQALEPFPGVLALVAVDRPTHVKELSGDLSQVGSYERAVELGRRNLAALPLPAVERLLADDEDEGSAVHLLMSDDFFGASRAIILEDILDRALGTSIPEAGVFLVVPNRHLLAVHIPTGSPSTVGALSLLSNIGFGECKSAPGPISPFVYHVSRDGSGAQVSSIQDGKVVFSVIGQVEDAFRTLGLLE